MGAESAYDWGRPCDAFRRIPTAVLYRRGALRLLHGLPLAAVLPTQSCRGDLGIPEDLYKANLVFDPEIKLGSLMSNSMDKGDAKVWFGATPPDLTLISRQATRVALHLPARVYEDDLRPYGVNNRAIPMSVCRMY